MDVNTNINTIGYVSVTQGVKFNKSQAQGMVLHNMASASDSTPVAGQTILESTDNTLMYYNGTRWVIPAEAMTTEDFQDNVGAMVSSTNTVTMGYNDTTGKIESNVVDNTNKQKVSILQSGTVKATRANLNFTGTSNVLVSIVDDTTNDKANINLSLSGVSLDSHNHDSQYQPLNANLTAMSNTSTTGVLVRTGNNTYATRAITSSNSSITISNTSGIGGDIVVTLNPGSISIGDLSGTLPVNKGGTGLSAQLSANYVMAENIAGTALVGKAITGVTNRTTISHTDSAITISLPQDIATTSSPTFAKVIVSASPTADNELANKAYVDASAAGLQLKDSADMCAPSNVTLSGIQNLDGVTGAAGKVVLLINQTNAVENGTWDMASGSWTRHPDMDTWAEFKSAYVFVKSGNLYAGTGYVNKTTVSGSTILATTWTIFTQGAQYTPGSGIYGDGTGNRTFNVGAGNGIEVSTDAIAVKLATNSGMEFVSGGVKNKLGAGLTIDGSGAIAASLQKKIYTISLTAGATYTLSNETGSEYAIVIVKDSAGNEVMLDKNITTSNITLTSSKSMNNAKVTVIG